MPSSTQPLNNFSHNITVIAFKRPELLETILRMLRSNLDVAHCPIYIFIDGARTHVAGEKEKVEATRMLAEKFEWTGKKKIFCSKENRGVLNGVRYAIDSSLKDFESTIIVEDDIVTSPFFYRFMVRGLQQFWNEQKVGAICGHVYNFSREIYNPKHAYFLAHFACWGWATWRDRWQNVEWDTAILHKTLKKSKRRKELDFGIGTCVSGLLDAQHRRKINTWDVQVGISFFLQNKLCLFPPESITQNIGWRPETGGAHMTSHINPNSPMAYNEVMLEKTIEVNASKEAWHAYSKMYYPPRKKIYFLVKNIVLFFFPFLRTLSRKVKNN